MSILRFEEGYFERLWGGSRLRDLFGKPVPEAVIGEAWLVSDHTVLESVVAEGPDKGRTLRELLVEDAKAVLGERPRLTPEGRFPLLLKIIDAGEALSVQVHPDDACARRLNEPDVGKTEMWHVLDAKSGSELICGLDPSMSRDRFARAVEDGSVEQLMTRFPAKKGLSLFVPAGTVHAIGGGIVLAEIQQNSDITYRLYDWGRVDHQGKRRELHVEKAMEAVHFGEEYRGPAHPLEYWHAGVRCSVLAVSRYFAAQLVRLNGSFRHDIDGKTFHIVLATEGRLAFSDGKGEPRSIVPGEAILIPGGLAYFAVEGDGAFLDYFVPDVQEDIVEPLTKAGYSAEDIAAVRY